MEKNLDCLEGPMAQFVYVSGLKQLENIRYYKVNGSLDKKD